MACLLVHFILFQFISLRLIILYFNSRSHLFHPQADHRLSGFTLNFKTHFSPLLVPQSEAQCFFLFQSDLILYDLAKRVLEQFVQLVNQPEVRLTSRFVSQP